MDLFAYKVLHIIGAFYLFASLGALALRRADGNTAGSKLDTITHGVALLVMLVTGFGMLAVLGMAGGIPGWVWAKLVIWLILGAALALVRRMPQLSAVWWWGLPLLGGVAAWLALTKPF